MLAKPVNHTQIPVIYPKLSDTQVEIQQLSSNQWIRTICFGKHRGITQAVAEDQQKIVKTCVNQVRQLCDKYTKFSARLGACVSVHWWADYQPTQLS